MSLESETKEILRNYGIVADKKFGQNFLIDENAIENIINSSEISKQDLVIEIGPGLGTLTKKLVDKAGKVICIELDRRMISILEKRFLGYNNLEIINNDILKTDLEKIIRDNCEYTKVKIVANLPYYITTPIIMKLLEDRLSIDLITIMVQKEVADRILASPGGKDYGVLTLSIKYYASSEKIVEVSRQGFIPSPNVDSSVVMLKLYKEIPYEIKDEKLFFEIIKGGFGQRRKLFSNAVESVLSKYSITKDEFNEILAHYGIDELQRAETLSIDEFINISNDISYIKKCRE